MTKDFPQNEELTDEEILRIRKEFNIVPYRDTIKPIRVSKPKKSTNGYLWNEFIELGKRFRFIKGHKCSNTGRTWLKKGHSLNKGTKRPYMIERNKLRIGIKNPKVSESNGRRVGMKYNKNGKV